MKKVAQRKSAPRPRRSPQPAKPSPQGKSVPIVGIGASAGGLEAFTQLLQHLPADTGMAFVLVQHLDPDHASALTGLLARTTTMPVREVTDQLLVQPDHVYVIPPNAGMALARGTLKLLPRQSQPRGGHRPIDSFFESLAQDQHERAIGVVLSGTASDGTLGLEAIKAEGGLTFAQDDSAKYESMPRSAVAAGCVDLVLSPEKIAAELARIARHPSLKTGRRPASAGEGLALPGAGGGGPSGDDTALNRLFLLLRNHFGVDFSLYKPATIQRRIGRRMVLSKSETLAAYVNALRANAQELEALYSDLLINVTSFFRDPEAFAALKRKVFPKLLQPGRREPVRFWVLGCSTGQEAYSLAMACMEFCENIPRTPKLQVFATDLNEKLLEKARHGLYAKHQVEELSPERLRRFFVEEQGGYRAAKALRETVIFARQNLLSDPPFSRLDLISCRNLLIYIEANLQDKILPTFHYALKPGGFLFLGASESIGSFTNLFEPVDKKHKIFSRKAGTTPGLRLPVSRSHPASESDGEDNAPARSLPEGASATELDAQREADRLTLARFAPPGVLVNSEFQILQFRGRTGPYLQPPSGKASFDLLKMAREGLMLPLHAALKRAQKQNQVVRTENVRMNQAGAAQTINLEIVPLKHLKGRCYLVVFEEAAGPKAGGDGSSQPPSRRGQTAGPVGRSDTSRRITELERELAETRDYLQSLQEQHEAANEELQSSNEEVNSANEELQSINEELETSKEELESTNEELTTLNEESASRNQELNRLNSDLHNLHLSINTPILLLGLDLTIRRFTPPAEKLFNLLPSDAGRPLRSLRHNLEFPELESFLANVIDDATPQQREVRDKAGRWYSLRVRPYLTWDRQIDGAVLMLVDIDALKQAEQEIREERDFTKAVIESVPPLLILKPDLRVQVANSSFYEAFQVSPAQTENRVIFELGNRQWDMPELRTLLEEILPRNRSFKHFEVTHAFETVGRRTMLLSGRQVENLQLIVLSIEDITQRKAAEEALRQAKDELATYTSHLEHFSHAIVHDMRAPLRAMQSFAAVLELKSSGCKDAEGLDYLRRIQVAAGRLDELIRDSLNYTKVMRGQMSLKPVNLSGLLRGILETYPNLQPPAVEIQSELEDDVVVLGNEAALTQCLSNLLGNAVKFVAPGVKPRVRIWAEERGECPGTVTHPSPTPKIRIWVEDNGIGIPTDAHGRIFGMFERLHLEAEYPGTGIGLAIVRKAIEQMGGMAGVESEAGKGSRFWIELPKAPRVQG